MCEVHVRPWAVSSERSKSLLRVVLRVVPACCTACCACVLCLRVVPACCACVLCLNVIPACCACVLSLGGPPVPGLPPVCRPYPVLRLPPVLGLLARLPPLLDPRASCLQRGTPRGLTPHPLPLHSHSSLHSHSICSSGCTLFTRSALALHSLYALPYALRAARRPGR
jgi:hypothetical protein